MLNRCATTGQIGSVIIPGAIGTTIVVTRVVIIIATAATGAGPIGTIGGTIATSAIIKATAGGTATAM